MKRSKQTELPGMPKLPAVAKEARAWLAAKEALKHAQETLKDKTAAVLAAMKKEKIERYVLEDPENARTFTIRKVGDALVVKRATTGVKPRGRKNRG